jgi:UPF0176 protein
LHWHGLSKRINFTIGNFLTDLHSVNSILNASTYRFVPLDDYREHQAPLRNLCTRLRLKGTILLAPEGINIALAGKRPDVEVFKTALNKDPRFAGLTFNHSLSGSVPFEHLRVKLKKEIIPLGLADIRPERSTASRISPAVLRHWLDRSYACTLLDTRNDYESSLGSFRDAIKPAIRHFRDFPQAAQQLDQEMKTRPLVTFCTGGVRCEKAALLLKRLGFREVYQLDGGILTYLSSCGDAHWEGECFVFDERVSLNSRLAEAGTQLCKRCQSPLTDSYGRPLKHRADQRCPSCAGTTNVELTGNA